MDEQVPDSTVLCRFRGALSKGNAFEKLLLIINQRLEDNNLMVITENCRCKLTPTLRKPRGKEYETVVEDRKETETKNKYYKIN